MDFVVFLAKQTLGYIHKVNEFKSENEEKCDVYQDQPISPSLRLNYQSSYPSVTNLLGNEQNNVHFKANNSMNNSMLMESKSSSTITEEDIHKALKVQNEFHKQNELLSREFSPNKLTLNDVDKFNSRTLSRQEINPLLSQKAGSKSSVNFDEKDSIKSQQNIELNTKWKFVTLSQQNDKSKNIEQYIGKMLNTQKYNRKGTKIKYLKSSTQIIPRSDGTFKSKFKHLFKKKKI